MAGNQQNQNQQQNQRQNQQQQTTSNGPLGANDGTTGITGSQDSFSGNFAGTPGSKNIEGATSITGSIHQQTPDPDAGSPGTNPRT